MPRTKALAAVNEEKDIKTIVDGINSGSLCGLRISNAFSERFGLRILGARLREGGSRKTHYDFDINVEGFGWKHVEHKGSKEVRPISAKERPWSAGVQFHNGSCDKYSIAKRYARIWYDTHISSGSLTSLFRCTSHIPSFDDWFKKDCKVQANPRTEYGKELKRKVRLERGLHSSLLECRTPVVKQFTFTEADKRELINEVLPIANSALLKKEYWLTVRGLLDGTFNVAWYPQFKIEKIDDVIIKKSLDILFTFECSDNFRFSAILRWGKGAGFSCLRVDLK